MSLKPSCRSRSCQLTFYQILKTSSVNRKRISQTPIKQFQRRYVSSPQFVHADTVSAADCPPIRQEEFDTSAEQKDARLKTNSLEKLARLSWSGSRSIPASQLVSTWTELLVGLTSDSEDGARIRKTAARRAKAYTQAWEAKGRLPRRASVSSDASIHLGQLLPWLLAGKTSTSPHQALILLNNIPWLHRDFSTRADCLIYLREHFWPEIQADPELLSAFQKQMIRLQDANSWPEHNLSIAYFRLLFQDESPEKSQKIIAKYLEHYSVLPVPLALYITDVCTKFGYVSGALTALANLPADIFQESGSDILRRCTNLLLQDSIEVVNGMPRFRVLTRLLELGLRPDAILHKMAIENAFYAKLPTVAWDLFHYTRQQHVQITPRAHLLLLKDAFQRHNLENLNAIMSAIHEQEHLAQDPHLVGYTMNILRILYRDEPKFKSEDAVARLLAIYDRAFNRSALERLGLAPSLTTSKSRPDPQSLSLGHALWSYILVQHNELQVYNLWERVKLAIEEGDVDIIALARYDILYNALIHYSSLRWYRLVKVTEVLEYMLEKGLCEPTPLTWSLALCAFLRHKRPAPAWKIWELMKTRNMAFNVQDWQYFLDRNPDSPIAAELKTILGIPQTSTVAAEASDEMPQPVIQGETK